MTIRQTPYGKKLTDYLQVKADAMALPLSGTFELSPVCNFSCRMCYVRKTQAEVNASPRKIMTLEDWRRIAREAKAAGTLFLLLTGGEPLLWPDFWTLYDELTEMGFLVSVNTNGSLIDEEAIAHFRAKPPRRINITLYGAGEESYRSLCGNGAFSAVDRAIRGLTNAGIPVKLNCSLTPENAADLDGIVDYAKQRDLPLTVTTYMFPPVRRDSSMVGINERFTPEESAYYMLRYLEKDRGGEAYQAYLQSVLSGYVQPPGLDEGCVDPLDGKIRCRAGKSTFWISWDGWMMACGMMPEPRVDMKKMIFPQAWEELKTLTGAVRLSGVCDKCPNLKLCHPCGAIAYAETGETGGIPEYRCRATRELHRIARETLQPG